MLESLRASRASVRPRAHPPASALALRAGLASIKRGRRRLSSVVHQGRKPESALVLQLQLRSLTRQLSIRNPQKPPTQTFCGSYEDFDLPFAVHARGAFRFAREF